MGENLTLRQDMVAAVGEGSFHIYPVATINEGIALLTGVDAGGADTEGAYPRQTTNGAVRARPKDLAEKVKASSPNGHGSELGPERS